MGKSIAPDKRNLLGFNNEMLRCMDNVELKEKCCFFMTKKLQHGNKIKAVAVNGMPAIP